MLTLRTPVLALACSLVGAVWPSGCVSSPTGPMSGQANTAVTPEPEDAPPDVHFLATSPTLDGLTAGHPADLAWREPDGSPYFLWTTLADAPGARAFTFNRAYLVRQSGQTFWAFLDPQGYSEHWGSPLNRFLLMKHVRETAAMPADRQCDGPDSTAELLSRAPDGRALVRVTYASLMGDFANHVNTPSWLIYFPATGAPVLASLDIDGDRSLHNGAMLESFSKEFQVVWHPSTASTPFHLLVHESEWRGFLGEEGGAECTTHTDAIWSGPLPLNKIRAHAPSYAIADGATSLEMFSKALAELDSSWTSSGWVTPAQRVYALRHWREAVMDANPTLSPERPPSKGVHIMVPDERATNDSILKQVRQERASAEGH